MVKRQDGGDWQWLSTLVVGVTLFLYLFQSDWLRQQLDDLWGGVSMQLTGLVIVLVVLVVFASAVRVLREYERAVVFRFGRLARALWNPGGNGNGPGIILLLPLIDRIVRVSLRLVTLDVPPQEVITKDNVTTNVNAVVYFRVLDPEKATVEVEDFLQATFQIAQTTLRSVLGQVELDQILTERENLNKRLQEIIDEHTDPWGIKVKAVEIKDVRIPQEMQRAIARQAEAERERRSKIISAEGELQAAEKLQEAARILTRNPASIQLRYLQTLIDISSERSTSTIIFPLPIDMLRALAAATDGKEG